MMARTRSCLNSFIKDSVDSSCLTTPSDQCQAYVPAVHASASESKRALGTDRRKSPE